MLYHYHCIIYYYYYVIINIYHLYLKEGTEEKKKKKHLNFCPLLFSNSTNCNNNFTYLNSDATICNATIALQLLRLHHKRVLLSAQQN